MRSLINEVAVLKKLMHEILGFTRLQGFDHNSLEDNVSVLRPYLRAKDGWDNSSNKLSPQLSPKRKVETLNLDT